MLMNDVILEHYSIISIISIDILSLRALGTRGKGALM